MDKLKSYLLFYLLVNISMSVSLAFWGEDESQDVNPNILVFGGNGFLGSETVSSLLETGLTNITIVNRGGKYWDAQDRIFSKVKSIKCDRSKPSKLEEMCPELITDLKENNYDFVVDFSVKSAAVMTATLKLLNNKDAVYIIMSSDEVYDVGNKTHDGLTQENDGARPEDEERMKELCYYFKAGNIKLQIEEALVAHCKESDLKYVILRLSDVIGPRDTTFRWWIYQLWARLSPVMKEHPIHIPSFLEGYHMSFAYSKDVAAMITSIVTRPNIDDLKNQAFNLAWPKTLTMLDVIDEIKLNLDMKNLDVEIVDTLEHQDHFFTYPSTRSGPVSVTKATEMLEWKPTEWQEAVKETTSFFEQAMTDLKFASQRDEAIQVVGSGLFSNHLMKFYEALEEVYDIDLKHFKKQRDEL